MHERTSSLIGDDGAIFDFAVLLEQASQPVGSHIECKSSHEQLAVVHIILSIWCSKLSALRCIWATASSTRRRLFRVIMSDSSQVAEKLATLLAAHERNVKR